MTTIRLYIDEDAMDRRFVEALRLRDVDVITPGETRTTGFSDDEQLVLAMEQGRVFYTFNVADFCQLHFQWLEAGKAHAGIIISSQNYAFGEQLRRVLKLMSV
ncbi:MAG: DUF5615 family PIN-like protein [Cyanobacteria bacterium]|nr:DUF5615 family PIN-like protein [Cyanobacteriota bacterium]MDW8202059.1 DUF5615 family PIN-like protein [Cyanobacteriota bacterium SKYGB_h_bin112]